MTYLLTYFHQQHKVLLKVTYHMALDYHFEILLWIQYHQELVGQ